MVRVEAPKGTWQDDIEVKRANLCSQIVLGSNPSFASFSPYIILGKSPKVSGFSFFISEMGIIKPWPGSSAAVPNLLGSRDGFPWMGQGQEVGLRQ